MGNRAGLLDRAAAHAEHRRALGYAGPRAASRADRPAAGRPGATRSPHRAPARSGSPGRGRSLSPHQAPADGRPRGPMRSPHRAPARSGSPGRGRSRQRPSGSGPQPVSRTDAQPAAPTGTQPGTDGAVGVRRLGQGSAGTPSPATATFPPRRQRRPRARARERIWRLAGHRAAREAGAAFAPGGQARPAEPLARFGQPLKRGRGVLMRRLALPGAVLLALAVVFVIARVTRPGASQVTVQGGQGAAVTSVTRSCPPAAPGSGTAQISMIALPARAAAAVLPPAQAPPGPPPRLPAPPRSARSSPRLPPLRGGKTPSAGLQPAGLGRQASPAGTASPRASRPRKRRGRRPSPCPRRARSRR